jgi:hypothetical protein
MKSLNLSQIFIPHVLMNKGQKKVMKTRSQSRMSPVIVPNVRGFVIMKSGLDLNRRKFLNIIQKSGKNLQTVFNPDTKRSQVSISTNDQDVQKILRVLGDYNLLAGRNVSDVVILHSKKDCKAQQYHTDFPDHAKFMDDKPLSVLFALENNTKIYTKEKCIKIDRGDILIWDGDLVHAGGDYSEENVRIHMYLDTYNAKRSSNTTYNLEN